MVEKDSGLEGYLLRPLSAKLLPPTIAEKEGLVDRKKLADVSGRSRQAQFELARKYGIEKYPAPAGGCRLTEGGFAERLKKLTEFKKDISPDDAALAGIGRHFFEGKSWIILGRDHNENEFLKEAFKEDDFFVELADLPGPSALVRGKIDQATKEKTKELMLKFSPKIKEKDAAKVKFIEKI